MLTSFKIHSRFLSYASYSEVMKKSKALILSLIFCILLPVCSHAVPVSPDPPGKKEVLVHMVLVNFKKEATAAQLARVDSLVMRMPVHIKEIRSLTWKKKIGLPNETTEYYHILMVTFKNLDNLHTYDNHPEHLRVLAAVLPIKEKILRFNYFE